MEAKFFQGNRKKLYDSLPDNTLLIMSAGSCVRKTADENYLFYADRSFLYMTGIEQEKTILMVEKENGNVVETLYVLPPDMLAERWTGTRLKPEEVTAISGVENIAWLGDWEEKVKALIRGGHFERVAMYLYKHDPEDADTDNIKIARSLRHGTRASCSRTFPDRFAVSARSSSHAKSQQSRKLLRLLEMVS